MQEYHFHIVNVFTQASLEGNPLCVFENAQGLTDDLMLKLAQQFNLSETVFLFPHDNTNYPDCAYDYHLRIYTPSYELPFAGHPVIGSAAIAETLLNKSNIKFQCKSGIVNVNFDNQAHTWHLKTPDFPIKYKPLKNDELVNLERLINKKNLPSLPAFINTGSEQLIIELSSFTEVDNVTINYELLDKWPTGESGRKTAYIFAKQLQSDGSYIIYARFLFLSHHGYVGEDPGTGSACANLGGWFIHNEFPFPLKAHITQGVKMGRKCELQLNVKNTSKKEIFVGGQVVKLAQGTLTL